MTRTTYGPLREVHHIEELAKGPNGGEAWLLTLECGHIAIRAKPSPDPVQAVGMVMTLGVDRFMRRMCAPHKVRCRTCGGWSEGQEEEDG